MITVRSVVAQSRLLWREPMQVNEERQEGDAHDNGEISGGAYRMRAVR